MKTFILASFLVFLNSAGAAQTCKEPVKINGEDVSECKLVKSYKGSIDPEGQRSGCAFILRSVECKYPGGARREQLIFVNQQSPDSALSWQCQAGGPNGNDANVMDGFETDAEAYDCFSDVRGAVFDNFGFDSYNLRLEPFNRGGGEKLTDQPEMPAQKEVKKLIDPGAVQ